MPTAFVDVAGSAELVAAVHHRLRDALKHTALAGFTHGEGALEGGATLPGPLPQLCFTPPQFARRLGARCDARSGARLTEPPTALR